ncbi:putative protein N(5)-glutamine methyltransferase [Auraticoccus monumenti]|uniref:peptide chain release factor N(5)-glutamine methyltransferase n=1 Tax=Auraticoccus monumenti TaxID=675864 RepID=A0A1G6ZDG6_9ACTN|nr:putative protein N(5)-glutamine methyltransferase [Auraticoccus monumenti]SDE00581.1 release factor glutamine methyltransferase [Auraticoccus monumenti]
MLEVPPVLVDVLATRLREAGCVYAEEEVEVLRQSARTRYQLRQMAEARAEGVPLEHVVGWAEFAGLRIPVGPGVFVPRPRTEHLVAVAAGLARPRDVVVDLCCGSGALARALHERVPGLVLHASDVLPAAVHSARTTLAGIGEVHLGDLYDALPGDLRGRVDVLVANVPYVPTAAIALMPREAREHVPPVTLDGGTDGLDVLRRVAADAPSWLGPGGHLLSEVAEDQVQPALEVLRRAGLDPRSSSDEELDASVVLARRPADDVHGPP